MPSEFDLSTVKVVIYGLGLMGGSLALALRGKCAQIIGIDPAPEVQRLADELRVVDQIYPAPNNSCADCNLIVISTPVRSIISILHALPDVHTSSPVVLDMGSTKTAITQAMQSLPPRFDPIGGHPMCGKETSGMINAEKNLFFQAPFALIALDRTSQLARDMAKALVHAIGAYPLWIDADTHDRWVAATSHLPYLVANALAANTPHEAAPLIGSGFRSTTRLANSSLSMMMDILTTNQKNIIATLGNYIEILNTIYFALFHEDENLLRELLCRGKGNYEIFNQNHHQDKSRKSL